MAFRQNYNFLKESFTSMKNAQTKQVLSHPKSATLNQDRDNNMKLANMEKKHTFSEIISEFR